MKNDRTVKQQAKLFEGRDHWHLNSEKDVTFSDGPNGLRIEDEEGLGFTHSKKATAFPTASCAGCSYDRDLMEEYGRMIAEECISEKVDVILGPGVTTKRSPLCGRNFEYYSEDPVLSGEYAASYIKGVQSKGIGTSLKHFAGNSRELARQAVDSVMDQRTLHEIYLRQFETAVRKAHPWTLMAAYNRLNGIYCCENKELLQEARSWGFDGLFISDWGGVADPVRSLESGLNLEMPGPTGSASVIVKAVEKGKVSKECLEESTQYMDRFIDRCGRYTVKDYDQNEHDAFAQKAAEESIVLLKNEGILPLKQTDRIAVIGPFAQHPFIQGYGSSKVNPVHQDSLLSDLDAQGTAYTYAQGFSLENEEIDETLHDQAMKAAEGKDKVIVILGELPGSGGEGFDRTTMDLPFNQNTLVRDLIHACRHVIIVLQTGAPVTMPWREMADGIIVEYAAGQKSGAALRSVLYGEVDPSGHLAETWPLRSEDNPSSRYFDNEILQSQYREGIFCGYRYYDTFQIPTAYSFGYGLSYTEFSFADLQAEDREDGVHVSVKVTNTGAVDGRAVVQIYAGMKDSRIARASKELKDFASVPLKAGEEKEVQLLIDRSLFQYYDVRTKSWQVEKGTYQIMAGRAVNDIVLTDEVMLEGIEDAYSTLQKSFIQHDAGMVYVSDHDFAQMLGYEIPKIRSARPFTANTTIRELKESGFGRFVNYAISKILKLKMWHNIDDASVFNAPIRQLLWLKDHYSWDTVNAAVSYLNHHGGREFMDVIRNLKHTKSDS